MMTYDIFGDLFDLRNIVDKFFEETPSRLRRREYPFVRIYEGNDNLEVHAVMPGVDSKDLSINLVDNSLLIEGEKKEDYTDHPYIRKERLFGNIKKSVKLPYRVDTNKINASLTNGILTVRLSRSEDTKPKKIQIN